MAGSLNKVCLLGNVGKDPDIRATQSGDRIANLSIATSETWKDKNSGEKRERTEWHRIVVFNDGLTGVIERYVKRGSKIYVEGKLQTRKWVDQAGVEKYSTEIVLDKFGGTLILLGDRGESGGSDRGDGGYQRRDPPAGGASRTAASSGSQWDQPRSNDLDDEIPF